MTTSEDKKPKKTTGPRKSTPEERRREAILERILKNYDTWRQLVLDEGIHTLRCDGEEFNFFDILDGFEFLAPRIRQAVWLQCVLDYTEEDTAKMMGFVKWSTPVQTYRRQGLQKLLAYHDNPRSLRKRNWEPRDLRRKGRDESQSSSRSTQSTEVETPRPTTSDS